MTKLEIVDLHAQVEDIKILKGINITFQTGQLHALMGPNGNGKSTLMAVIMGNPKYKVTKGDILLNGESILDMPVDERAKAGIFLAMQYPQEIPGVMNSEFLKTAMNASGNKVSVLEFRKQLDEAAQELHMNTGLASRFLNEGFSGGEKKKNEILQMKLLKPKLALLDEIDSGLDIDALNVVAKELNTMKSESFGAVLISHYERLFSMVEPTHASVIVEGVVVKQGGYEVVKKIDTEGYQWLRDELGIEIKDNK